VERRSATHDLRVVSLVASLGISGCSLLVSLDGLSGASGDRDAGGIDSGVLDAPPATADANRPLCGGKDCLGGACVAGACGPAVLASGQKEPRGIALFGEHVYWVTASGAVMRVGRTGGAPEQLAAGTKMVSIAVDATGVFFTDEGAGKVSMVPLAGGAVVDLASGEPSPWGIALDGTNAYYSTSTAVRRVRQAGGAAPEDVRTGLPTPRKVVIGSGRVFWLYESATGQAPTVESMLLAGGGPQCHFNGQASPHGLAVDSTSIFHTLHLAAPGGAIRKKPLSETCATEAKVVGSGLALPFELAVDATTVYWTVDQPNGAVVAVDKQGTAPPRELATGQDSPWGIAVDPSSGTLYWTNGGADGAVMLLVR
jgi:hypothetical protein